ncbi:hypothetical protein [Nocardioides humi]|uniref:Ig-like domain-containing protein n=1 Tax=Nocardioides humi TaxID=449461 RepID=A0ABN2A9F6_9ACTN|nr:hypothetical protein [Nocardioides humi]
MDRWRLHIVVPAVLLAVVASLATAVPGAGTEPPASASWEPTWARQWGTSAGDPIGGVAVVDDAVYVAGWTRGTLPGQLPGIGADAWVRKMSLTGELLWERQMSETGDQTITAIAADADHVVVVGTTGRLAFRWVLTSSGVTLMWQGVGGDAPALTSYEGVVLAGDWTYVVGTVNEALPGQTFGGGSDIFLRRYPTTSWAASWTTQIPGPLFDAAGGLALGSEGLVATGSTNGTLPGTVGSAGLWDVVVLGVAPATGAVTWARQFGGPGNDYGRAIAADATRVYVAGQTRGLPGQPDGGAGDAFLSSFTSAGAQQWVRTLGTAEEDGAEAVTATPRGPVVAGTTRGELAGIHGGEDAFWAEYDPAGTRTGVDQFGTADTDNYPRLGYRDALYVAVHAGGALPGPYAGGADPALFRLARFPDPPVAAAPATLRPDAAVRLPGKRWKRQVSRAVRTGRSQRAVVRVRNAGEGPAAIRVAGCSPKQVRVTWRSAGRKVTSAVRKGVFTTPVLAPGRSVRLRATLTVARSAKPGKRVCDVVAESGTTRDTVRIRLVVRR